MPTLAELDYLPLPHPVRKALRQLLSRHRDWPKYRHTHKLPPVSQMRRAQWLAAAIALNIDIEKMVHDHCERTGAQFGRRKHLEISAKAREWL